jgi:hypothetical protein
VLVLSPPCIDYTSLQNANQRSPRQRGKLRRRRAVSKRIFSNTYDLALQQVGENRSAIGEQPPKACSWTRTKWKDIKKLLPQHVIVKGCQVGLRAPDTNRLMSKEWFFCTDSPDIAVALRRFSKCTCSRAVLPHETCEGKHRTETSQTYPLKLCRALIRGARKAALAGPSVTLSASQAAHLATKRSIWQQSGSAKKKAQRRNHWSTQPHAAKVREKCRRASYAAIPRSTAPLRKLCRGLLPSCRGGKAMPPATVEAALRVRLQERYGKVCVFCKRCLASYKQRVLV